MVPPALPPEGPARRGGRGSLARRLTWLIVAVTGGALLAACAAFILYDRYAYRAALEDQLWVQARIIGATSLGPLLLGDHLGAARTLAMLAASPDLRGAAIYDPQGQRFASYRRDHAAAWPQHLRLPPRPRPQVSFRPDSVTVAQPVRFGGATVGTVYLRSDLAQLTQRGRHYLLIAAIVWAATLAAAWIFSTRARHAIVEPIAALARTADAITRQGDYRLRARSRQAGEELDLLVAAFNAMVAAVQARDAELAQAAQLLEARVAERTAQLTAVNRELEAFSYSVSHDLRAPLRGIDGFSQALLEDYGPRMDDAARNYLRRIRAATQRMGMLIDDLLQLARISRTQMRFEDCDLSALAHGVMDELRQEAPERRAEIEIAPRLHAWCDCTLLRIVLANLLGNAWKFTSKQPAARIGFRREATPEGLAFAIRDNGAGFDPNHASQLFSPFQRLHPAAEFPGTGIGLATVQRILQRHGGRVWAHARPGEGAAFFFTLPAGPD
ncbi:MAG: sensor histidine kinase [Terriglobales bacterium]